MSKKAQNTSTMGIKCRVANIVRSSFYRVDLDLLTDEQKSDLLSKIAAETYKMHEELNAYKAKRKFKAGVARERVLRGYVPKKKTSLAEWNVMQDAAFKASVSEVIS